jgi:hypothetical protein
MIYAVNIARDGEIGTEHLPANLFLAAKDRIPRARPERKITHENIITLRDSERVAIEEALAKTNENVPKVFIGGQ